MRKPASLAIVAFALATAARTSLVDPQFDARQNVRINRDLLESPGAQWLDAITIEHRLGAADLMWLAIIQNLADVSRTTDADWDRVVRWTNIATDLDPRYFTIYHSVAICLSIIAKRPDESDVILMKGRTHLPQRWELPFVMGFNAYFHRTDPIAGSELMATAGKLPKAPAYVTALSGRMRFQAGDEDAAIQMLESMAAELDEAGKANVEERIKMLKSEHRFRVYDQACKRFEEANGRLPKEPQELVLLGLVNEPPVDYLDSPIILDENCRATSKIIHTREAEAKERSFRALKGPSL